MSFVPGAMLFHLERCPVMKEFSFSTWVSQFVTETIKKNTISLSHIKSAYCMTGSGFKPGAYLVHNCGWHFRYSKSTIKALPATALGSTS